MVEVSVVIVVTCVPELLVAAVVVVEDAELALLDDAEEIIRTERPTC